MQKYDVVYKESSATIQPHFCRDWDENGGCYGTNPDHGYTLQEACAEVADFHQKQSEQWRAMTHPDVLFYEQGPSQ